MQRPALVPQDFRTLLFAGLAAVSIAAGSAIALGSALGGASSAASWSWAIAGGLGGLLLVAVAPGPDGWPARAGRAVAVGGLVLLPELVVDASLFPEGFGVFYTAALALGAAAALPSDRASSGVRVGAAGAAVALCVVLDRATGTGDLGFVAPAAAVFAVGLGDVAGAAARRGALVLAAAVLALPAAALAGGVGLATWERERDLRELRRSAQPPPAIVGRERIAWTFPAGGFETGPLVAGELVLADAVDAVHALDARSGRERWRVRVPGRDGLTRPLVHAGLLLYPANRAGLHALDLRDGRARWRFAPEGVAIADVEPSGGRLVVSAFGPRGVVLYGLRAEDGRRVWEAESPGEDLELDRVGTRVALRALGLWRPVDPATGRLGEPTSGPAQPYGFGSFRALHSTQRGWKFRPGWDATTSEPAEADGVVYVSVYVGAPENTGGLYAVDARTGKPRWLVEIAGGAAHRPALGRGLVYATSTDTCAAVGSCRTALYAIRR